MLERSSVFLSLTRALLGEVTPSLRTVQFELVDRNIDIFCIFDGSISEDDRESMSCMETEVMANFPEATVQARCLRIDLPDPVPNAPGRSVVFARRE
ncbi:hypothetical protein [Bradyrhizobium sp. SRS-191]|uniref:hypothetical protein n=1 Tax=Bradyrhizobium sp. SRS-191 TaxID=2962606 RepID=UPI00211EDA24|nr:hypothetical protein [Bradyrhizobium sp. SRS-191]